MQQRHVLIVEDNEDDSNLLSNIVEMVMKHKATVAADGTSAIQLANRTVFDLVLLDIQLPNLPGIDVAEAMRRIQGYRDVPIIAVTAYNLDSIQKDALQAGCDRYITKPVNIDTLIKVVSECLNLHPSL